MDIKSTPRTTLLQDLAKKGISPDDIEKLLNEAGRRGLSLKEREVLSQIFSDVQSGRKDYLSKPKIESVKDLYKLGEVKLNEASRVPLLNDPQGIKSSVPKKPILGGFSQSSGVKEYSPIDFEKQKEFENLENEIAKDKERMMYESEGASQTPDEDFFKRTEKQRVSDKLDEINRIKKARNKLATKRKLFGLEKLNQMDPDLSDIGKIPSFKDMIKTIADSEVGKFAGKALDVGGKMLDPLAVYDAATTLEEELKKDYSTLNDFEKTKSASNIASGTVEGLAGLAGTAATGAELFGAATKSPMIQSAIARTVNPIKRVAFPLAANAAFSKAIGPYLQKGAEEASKLKAGESSNLAPGIMKYFASDTANSGMMGRLGIPSEDLDKKMSKEQEIKKAYDKMRSIVKEQEPKPRTDFLNILKESNLSDEEILQKYKEAKEPDRQPSSEYKLPDKRPSTGEIVDHIVKTSLELGLDPALSLAQIERESAGFKLGAESPTGALGLGQMFNKAFIDAKNEDKDKKYLGELDYKEVHKNLNNWKQQINASLLYNKAIQNRYNKSGTLEEQLLTYLGGTSGDLENKRKVALSFKSDPDLYLKDIKEKKQKWENLLNNKEEFNKKMSELNRSPAQFSEKIAMETPEKKQQLQKIFKFLKASEDEKQNSLNDLLQYGMASDSEAAKSANESYARLQDLREKSKEFLPLADQMEKDVSELAANEKKYAEEPKEDIATKIKQDEILSKSPMTLQQILSEAFKKREESEFDARLGKLIAKAASAGAGLLTDTKVDADTEMFDELIKKSGQFEKDLSSTIAMQDLDPQSAKAQSYRKMLEEQARELGYENPDFSAMSMKDLKDLDDSFFRMSQRKQEKDYKIEQKKKDFLDKESKNFTTSRQTEVFENMSRTLQFVNEYIDNPNALESLMLKYDFAKVADPNTGVKTGELELFGLGGSLPQRVVNYISEFAKGKITPQKAIEFRNLIQNKVRFGAEGLRQKLGPAIERGKRYGLTEEEVVSGVAGPQYYNALYKGGSVDRYDKETEQKIQKVMAANPSATREQIITALKEAGKLK